MKTFLMPMLAAALLAPAASAQPVFGVAPPQAAQQSGGGLTLLRAVDRAQQQNNELRALRAEVDALEARSAQARVIPNPTIEYLREGTRDQEGSSALQVSIPVELGGKRGARVDAAMAELRVAAAHLAAGRLRVQAEVVAAFHEVYLAQRRLELATQTSASARQSSQSASARVVAGRISPVEETRAKVAEANVQVEAIQARRELAQARVRLSLLWGGDSATLPSLAAPDLPLPRAVSDAAIAAGLAQAPLLRQATADLDLRTAAARLERSQRYPDVSIIVGQKREGVRRERQTIVGLSVPLPIFDRNQGAIREAERRIEKSRAELTFNEQRLAAEVAQAAIRLNAALDQERVIREDVLPGGQLAFAAARIGFEAGKFNFLEVLDAQRTYFQAQAQHLRTISEAHRAAADLATLIGPALPNSTSHQQDAK